MPRSDGNLTNDQVLDLIKYNQKLKIATLESFA